MRHIPADSLSDLMLIIIIAASLGHQLQNGYKYRIRGWGLRDCESAFNLFCVSACMHQNLFASDKLITVCNSFSIVVDVIHVHDYQCKRIA